MTWHVKLLALTCEASGTAQEDGGIASAYGIDFDKDRPVHGANHDKYYLGGQPVEVPRHAEIAEYTARGILRTFEQICAQAHTEES